MEHIIGIDGGGTKTVLAAADLSGRILCRAEGGGSNVNALGADAVRCTLADLLGRMRALLKTTPAECRSLCIGAAGADRPREQGILRDIFHAEGYRCPMVITNDGITALWQGAPEGVGLVTESGTGSICYGRGADGRVARAGGWGHILGDEGSAYAIAWQMLHAVTCSADGRARPTALTPLVLGELGLRQPQELIAWAYRPDTGKREIARLARLADIAADGGDPAAENILRNAARDLAVCTDAVAGRLGFGQKPFPLVLAGSVLLHSRPVAESFRQQMAQRYPLAEFRPLGGHDTAAGAVRIAQDRLTGE